jgi:DNA modification methylase
VHVGDCRDLLAQLPDESVNCVVTSPPYWGLRDYGLPSTVWGGDPGHTHQWGKGIRLHKGGPHGDGVMLAGGRSVVEAQASTKTIDAGAFCACGAWRGQLGLEPTPDLFTAHFVEVFEGVRRVLRSDGVLWLNLGDSYATSGSSQGQPNRSPVSGLKPKDMVGIPWTVAFALRAAGWWLRSDVIWNKPNPMPEAVTDRRRHTSICSS